MKKSIKSTLKNVVVRCATLWEDEVKVDSEIFDDIYMEAATRCVEKRKNDEDFKLAIILECWEKKDVKNPLKHICYNSYYVMINAALYKKAEILRSNFMALHRMDLKKESVKGESEDGTKSNNEFTGSTPTR